ncbi:MAG: LON peptidase substrate-binding domain-containing protein, partial [Thermoleophilia bacterium]
MDDADDGLLGLFPLGIVLLPSEVVPLHIFEERYKVMIGECLDRESEFGIVWLSDKGLCDIGCTARITQVLDRFDDGRMNILVAGDRPFRLV